MKFQIKASILMFFLAFYTANGQHQKQIDSLLLLLEKSESERSKGFLLKELWKAHIDLDTEKARMYAEEMIEIGKTIENDTILTSGYQRLAIVHSYLDDYKESTKYYKKAFRIYQRDNAIHPMGMMLVNIGMDFSALGDLDSALYYYDEAMDTFELGKDTMGIGQVYRARVGDYLNQGYYRLALENAIKVADIFRKFKDDFEVSQAERTIGLIYEHMKDTANAERYMKKAIIYFKKSNEVRWLSSSQLNLAKFYVENNKKLKEAERLFESGISLAIELNYHANINYGYYWRGVYFTNLGKLKKAKIDLYKSLKLVDSFGLKNNQSMTKIAIGRVYLLEKENDSSIFYANSGLVLAKKLGLLQEQQKAYSLLSENLHMLNRNEEALFFYKLHKKINDSIYTIENGKRLSELQTIYETEKKEATLTIQGEEIKTLNEKARADQLTKGLYAGGAVAAAALSGLLFFGFRQRMKKNRISREKQEEIYKQEIEHKKKELTSQTLHLVQKNTFIQELKENLEKLRNSPEKFKMEFSRIVMLLKKENASDKDWDTFKSYFAEVHNDFDQKLKNLYADISEKEIRLAAFLRMNLTTKEIAATLNVMPDSILKSKYRLKKKLGLDKETDLNSFLNTL